MIGRLLRPSLLAAVVLLALATVATVWGTAVRAEADGARGAAEIVDEALVAEAEVLDVGRRHGERVAVLSYAPPPGATRAVTAVGIELPTVARVHLGDRDLTPGERVAVALPPSGEPPVLDPAGAGEGSGGHGAAWPPQGGRGHAVVRWTRRRAAGTSAASARR